MSLIHLPPLLRDDPVLADLAGGHARVIAVPEAPRAFFVAGLARLTERRPILVAVPTTSEAQQLAHDLEQFLGAGTAAMFPAWETLPFERVSPTIETMGRRLQTMWRLRVGRAGAPEHLPQVVVAPVRALVQRLGPHVEDVEPTVLRCGVQVDRDELVARLIATGYRREYQVEARGEVAVRGSIVDVYPSTAEHPVRIDLWGDEVDRLLSFSLADQRATGDLEDAWIFPARELLPTEEVCTRARELISAEQWGKAHWEQLAEGMLFDGMESWLPWLTAEEHLVTDLLPPEALVLLVEPKRMRDRAQDLLEEEASLAGVLATTWGAESDRQFERLSLPFDRLLAHTHADVWNVLSSPEGPSTPHLAGTGFDPVVGDATALAGRLRSQISDGFRVVIAAEGVGSAQRMQEVLAQEGLAVPLDELHEPGVTGEPATAGGGRAGRAGGADGADRAAPPGVRLVVAPLTHGFVLPTIHLAVVTEADLTGRRRVHRAPRPRRTRRGEDHYDALEVGDYVVHYHHGVGRYGGMVTRAIGGAERDYLLLEYRGGDKLYVPTDQVDGIRRYTGGETPTLHRLGGSDFQRSKAKVRSAAREIAEELVVLYRKRIATTGHAFALDTPWQHEIEEAFPYEETLDQLRAIEDVKADMERPRPMDRLVCGDVGYGKTEVAVRAAFKAVQDGKQVAVLVPTTLLANQHGETFRERYANYPVRVEVISRFLTPKEQTAVINGIAAGSVDVVIGTHRLLSDDVKFKDLGLLVVDEEQRFGVTHKERIKKLRADVDVLTLSATPIPRTLEMSLTGIRDLSIVNTPPEDRQPVLTYVGEEDDRAVSEAIRRELLREGQVFYVHNRVENIEMVADRVRELAPEARVVAAHGQMDEGQLERVMLDFAERRFDVLVCTTIIESGIDMPTVNTLVVNRPDLLGLAQLYQLRGRVGRSGQRAYAYFLWPRDRALTEEAYERLKTIGEHTDLGSGFKIAMRDLEIRGAGNLLGGSQSGHIAAVGFDLYCQMVTEAVNELKGEQPPEPGEITIDLPVDAHLPRDYVTRDDLRMEAYRRLAAVTSLGGVADVREEWLDRYGPPPAPAEALLGVARVRAECVRLGLREVTAQRDTVRLAPLHLRESQKVRLQRLAPDSILKDDDEVVLSFAALGGRRAVGAPRLSGIQLVDAFLDFLQELAPPESSVSIPVS